VTVMIELSTPADFGLNCTCKVQVPLGVSTFPLLQLLNTTVKSVASLSVKPVMVKTPPVLARLVLVYV